jgi:tRNA A58 N-methylase Trm61
VEDGYWFDNSLADEGNRLRLLEGIADPRSIRLLGQLDILPGWRCAELGAGGGSMALWLADQVGDEGSVMAVDRDVTLLEHLKDRSN